MRIISTLLAAIVLFGIGIPARAGDKPVTAQLSFERVFASPGLNGPAPRGVKLSPDGRWLTLLRGRADDRERYDLWGYDRTTGQWRMLVDSLKLSSGHALSEAEKMQRERLRIGDLKGIVSYDWSADGKALLVPLDGELYLAGLDGQATAYRRGRRRPAERAAQPARGVTLSFVRDRRLWVAPIAGGPPQAITPAETSRYRPLGRSRIRRAGGDGALRRGVVGARRQPHRGRALRRGAGCRRHSRGDRRQRHHHFSSSAIPPPAPPMPKSACGSCGPMAAARVQVDLGADKDIYLARVDWAKDGRTLYVQRENRVQTRLDMLAVDPATGAAQVAVHRARLRPGAGSTSPTITASSRTAA